MHTQVCIQHTKHVPVPAASSVQHGTSVDADMHWQERALWEENNLLRDFAEINYTGFYKITKKHDKMLRKVLPCILPVVRDAVTLSSFRHTFTQTHTISRAGSGRTAGPADARPHN